MNSNDNGYRLNRIDLVDRVVEAVKNNENIAQFFITFDGKENFPKVEGVVKRLNSFDHYARLHPEMIGGYLLHCNQGDAWAIKTTLEEELSLVQGLDYKVEAHLRIDKK